MKSNRVDTCLWHQLQLQKKKKWPLLFKDTADKAAKRETLLTVVSKQKGKKAGYVETDLDEESQSDQEEDARSDADDGTTDKATHATKINPQQTEDGGTAALSKLQEAITPSLCGPSKPSNLWELQDLICFQDGKPPGTMSHQNGQTTCPQSSIQPNLLCLSQLSNSG